MTDRENFFWRLALRSEAVQVAGQANPQFPQSCSVQLKLQ